MSKIMDFIKYGRQIGNVHSDGSVLRKGNSFFGKKVVRTLLDKDGVVQKFICKNYRTEDAFEVVHATPIKDDYLKRYNVVKTLYCHNPEHPFIQEHKFVGKYCNGSDGTNVGWYISSGSDISTKTHLLQPRTK